MKIVVLHGQSHRGSTWNVTQMLLDELRGQADTVFEFCANDAKPCAGCFACITKDEALCPHRAVLGPVIEAIEQADVVIAESPNYCMGMSGQLKTVFDHMAYRWMSHRPHAAMRGKVGVAISTTAGVGAAAVTKSIAQQFFWWGVPKTYRLHFAVSAMRWGDVSPARKAAIAKRVQKTAAQVKQAAGRARPGLKTTLVFNIMRAQQKGGAWNPADKKHWEENGWI